jgi:hypothetical protein
MIYFKKRKDEINLIEKTLEADQKALRGTYKSREVLFIYSAG